MTDQSGSAVIFATAQGKLISSLAIIALLLGIMAESRFGHKRLQFRENSLRSYHGLR